MIHFDIDPASIPRQLNALLKQHRAEIERLVAPGTHHNYDSLVLPLETLNDQLHRFWSPISHLNSVTSYEALRDAYNQCLPQLSEFHTWLGQHTGLYQAMLALKNAPEFDHYSIAQQTFIDHELRDFRLSGVHLNATDKEHYAKLEAELSQLSATFEEHVLDATDAWHYLVEDSALLSGLSESALANLAAAAAEKQLSGYLLTLQAPCTQAILTTAHNAALRERVYTALCTRASDQGPHAGLFDNSATMMRIVALRHELAQLLGFPQYVDYSLSTKMAQTAAEVTQFLERLLDAAKPFAERDIAQLTTFAQQQDLDRALAPWDIAYYSEALKKHLYAVDDESLRVYFPIEHVIQSLFQVCQRLYGLSFEECHEISTWHPDVRVFKILDEQKTLAYFYFDLFARAKKRGGAWMDDAQARWHKQLPIAYLTCNFSTPLNDTPSLLSHHEVITLFHEFGHGLHHMLTEIDVLGVSGINGVAWDAVELPSQILENWAWQAEALQFISQHYQHGTALPSELLQQMLAAKNFQAGMFLVRQLEFALFDFHLHLDFDPTQDATQIQRCLEAIRARCAVTPSVAFNRFQHSFSHIFAGGYGAGYYSYLWAEVLAQDAFGKFLEEGLFNPTTGTTFRRCVLAKGGSEPAAKLFKDFRGRAPELNALLQSYGLI